MLEGLLRRSFEQAYGKAGINEEQCEGTWLLQSHMRAKY